MIDVRTLRQQIYEELKERVIQGRLVPGEVLSLRKLAAEFGVSFMPVREAVWQLSSEGILTVESNKRITVSCLTPAELEDILSVRLLLESEAVKRSCINADQHQVERLQAVYGKMISVLSMPEKYTPANMKFHFVLYEGAQSPVLIEMIRKLWARVGPYFSIRAAEQRVITDAQENHKKMVEGYTKFDAEKVIEALRMDLTETAEYVLPLLREKETAANIKEKKCKREK
jgi:DNA-binding GntR family transcriptional regulator